MLHAYPEADIPILQLSLKNNLDPQYHLNLGKALRKLRYENILIIGSGFLTHNLRLLSRNSLDCENFVKSAKKSIMLPKSERDLNFLNWRSMPGAEIAHPREEHLIPLHVILGLADEDDTPLIVYDEMIQSFSMTSFMFK